MLFYKINKLFLSHLIYLFFNVLFIILYKNGEKTMNFNIEVNKETYDYVKEFEQQIGIGHSKLVLFSSCFYMRMLRRTADQRNLFTKITEQEIPYGDRILSIYLNDAIVGYFFNMDISPYLNKRLLTKMLLQFIKNYGNQILEENVLVKTKTISIDTRFFSIREKETHRSIKQLLRAAIAFNVADFYVDNKFKQIKIDKKIKDAIHGRKFRETFIFQGGEWKIYIAMQRQLLDFNLRQYLPGLVNHYFGNVL